MNIKLCLGVAVAMLVPRVASANGEAKNVVFFLGDGMGPTTVTAARIYKYGESGTLVMETLPRTARVKTYSQNAQTTDSAPSMSAYMTGVKMNNDVISMSSNTVHMPTCDSGNGTPVPTLLELSKAAGKAVGAVTTTEMTHATPAATYAHICNRDLARAIAVQAVPGGAGFNTALHDGVNVLFGGSQAHWLPQASPSTDTRDLFAELTANGYTVAKTKADFDAIVPSSTTKTIGIFSVKSHLQYELDRVRGTPTQPSLAEMTGKAIDVLEHASQASGGKGWFLMVEGGRIDHALHATNAKRALADAVAFDAAIAMALSKVNLNETLIVVTADHDHTMAINGYGRITGPTTATNPGVLGTVQNPDGTDVLDADGLPYTILSFGNGVRRPDVRGTDDVKALVESGPGSPSVASGNVLTIDPDGGAPWSDNYYQLSGVQTSGPGSETHGGSDVMLMAGGAGSTRFKGTLDNTAVFGLVKAALGL